MNTPMLVVALGFAFQVDTLEIMHFVDSISFKTSIPSAAAFKAGTVITHY